LSLPTTDVSEATNWSNLPIDKAYGVASAQREGVRCGGTSPGGETGECGGGGDGGGGGGIEGGISGGGGISLTKHSYASQASEPQGSSVLAYAIAV